MRNNTNYMETGLLTGLQLTSMFPQVILENFYKKSQNSIDAGRTQAPYAYVIPGDQADMTRVARVVELLRMQGIEIGRATGAIKVKEGSFPAGSFVIKRNQPYGRLAKILLEKQDYPEAKPPDPTLKTYDDSGWTMGLMAHVKVVGSADLTALDIPVQPVDHYEPAGSIDASGAANYAVLDFGSVNFATLRYRLKDVAILVAEKSFTSGGHTIPAGSFIVPGSAYARLKQAVEPLGLTAVGLTDKPDVPTHKVALPRVAIYSTWGSTQNVGWVRYAFDQYETPYTLILKDEVKKGNLHSRFDVIIIPSQGRSAKNIVFDIPMHGKPLPYTKTAEFKFLGEYGSSPDIRGGMGLAGLEELRKFVEEGGTLMTLGEASSVPGEFGITADIGCRASFEGVLCAGSDRDGQDHPAGESDLLRLHRGDDAGSLGEHRDAVGSAARQAERPDGVPGWAEERAQRRDGGRRGSQTSARRRRLPSRRRPGGAVRHEPGLPLAELRRVPDAVQRAIQL